MKSFVPSDIFSKHLEGAKKATDSALEQLSRREIDDFPPRKQSLSGTELQPTPQDHHEELRPE